MNESRFAGAIGPRMERARACSLATLSLCGFAFLLGADWPRPPIPGHAEWADLAVLPAAITALVCSPPWRSFWRRPALILAALYVAWAALSAMVHGAGYLKLAGIAELAVVLAVTASVAGDEQARRRILIALFAGCALLAVSGLFGSALALLHVPSPLYSARGGDLNLPMRPKGLCTTSNLLASLLLGPLLVLLHAPATTEKMLSRGVRRALLGLYSLTLVLTLSRTLLSLALGVLWPRLRGVRRALVAALFVALALASMRLDLYRYPGGALVVSTEPGLRFRFATSALASIRDSPFFGVGPGALPAHVAWPRPGDPISSHDAHTTALDVAATLGLPALAFYLCLLGVVLARARAGDPLSLAMRVAFVAWLFDALTVDVEYFRHYWLWMGLLLAK